MFRCNGEELADALRSSIFLSPIPVRFFKSCFWRTMDSHVRPITVRGIFNQSKVALPSPKLSLRSVYFQVAIPPKFGKFFLQSQVAIRHSYRLPDNHQNGPFRGPFFIVFPTRP